MGTWIPVAAINSDDSLSKQNVSQRPCLLRTRSIDDNSLIITVVSRVKKQDRQQKKHKANGT